MTISVIENETKEDSPLKVLTPIQVYISPILFPQMFCKRPEGKTFQAITTQSEIQIPKFTTERERWC